MKTIVREDLEALALGCALLGSGGGGNPAYDLLIAQNALELRDVQLISLEELSDDALVVPMAFVGAPLIATERLPSGKEFQTIIEHLEQSGREIVLMPAEIGGANGLCAFAVAAKMGLPVLDGDTLGRAFPQMQMSTCNLHGVSPSPAYFADCLGNFAMVEAKDAHAVERIGRHISISMGSSCAVAIYLMNGKQAKRAVIPGTITEALSLGNSMIAARHEGKGLGLGICLIEGIITEVKQEIKEGFLQGSVRIANPNNEIELFYQNEYLLACDRKSVLATTPDILSIVEKESGTPITTDGLRYGLKVALIVLPAPKVWQSDAGLALVGPEYFGYSVSYKPIQVEELL